MKKFRIKGVISVIIAFSMLLACAFCGAVSTSAADGTKITYKYVVTSELAAAFEGTVTYPADALTVDTITVLGTTGTSSHTEGKILFNSTSSDNVDFSKGQAVVTVVFAVKGDYDKNDIVTVLSEFYSTDKAQKGGNIPYKYKNVINGAVVSSGVADIDNPENDRTDPTTESTEPTSGKPTQPSDPTQPTSTDPSEKTFRVNYSYKATPNSDKLDTFPKNIKAETKEKAREIAVSSLPNIKNPYYENYRVESVAVTDSMVHILLACDERLYSVNVNGKELGTYRYQEKATVKADGKQSFLIDGEIVASGESFTFYVTGNMDIVTEDFVSDVDEATTLSDNSLYASNNSDGKVEIRMDLLATARVSDFARMGVAFTRSSVKNTDITAAVKEITSGTGRAQNGISVHNSTVDTANVSGQYQFTYVPTLTADSVGTDTVINFYAYTVKKNGEVLVSTPKRLNVADALA